MTESGLPFYNYFPSALAQWVQIESTSIASVPRKI